MVQASCGRPATQTGAGGTLLLDLGVEIPLGTTELTCSDIGTQVTLAFPGELSMSEDGWCQRPPGF